MARGTGHVTQLENTPCFNCSVFVWSVAKKIVKKNIPIRLKIIMPLGLTARLANVVEFWGKPNI